MLSTIEGGILLLVILRVAEAEFEDVSVGLSVFLLGFGGDDDECVVRETDHFRRRLSTVKAEKTGCALLYRVTAFREENLARLRTNPGLHFNDVQDFLFDHSRWRVVKVDQLARSLNPVLCRRGGSREAIIAISVKVLECASSVFQVSRIVLILQEHLLREAHLHSVIESLSSVQIVDDPLAGYGIAHLNESRAFFGLEEFDALHVAIETQQVEQLVAVRLLWIQSVENDDASLAGTHRRVWLLLRSILLSESGSIVLHAVSLGPPVGVSVSASGGAISSSDGVVRAGNARKIVRILLDAEWARWTLAGSRQKGLRSGRIGSARSKIPSFRIVLHHIQRLLLCVFGFEGATSRVDVGAVELPHGGRGGGNILKLHHRLQNRLTENNNFPNFAVLLANRVHHIHRDRIHGLPDREQDDVVFLGVAPLIGLIMSNRKFDFLALRKVEKGGILFHVDHLSLSSLHQFDGGLDALKFHQRLMFLAHHEDVGDLAPYSERVPEIGLDDGSVQRPHVDDGGRVEAVLVAPTIPLVSQIIRRLHRYDVRSQRLSVLISESFGRRSLWTESFARGHILKIAKRKKSRPARRMREMLPWFGSLL